MKRRIGGRGRQLERRDGEDRRGETLRKRASAGDGGDGGDAEKRKEDNGGRAQEA